MGNLRTIVEAQLGHPLDRQVDARIVADVVGDIAEISVAFELTGLNQQEILLLVRSSAPSPTCAGCGATPSPGDGFAQARSLFS
jgi:hypothetical protein